MKLENAIAVCALSASFAMAQDAPVRLRVRNALDAARAEETVEIQAAALAGRWKAADLFAPAKIFPGRLDLGSRSLAGEPDRDGLGMTVFDGHPIGHRRDHERRRRAGGVACASENFRDFGLDLLRLARDVGNDVSEYVERGDARIARAGDRLHRRDERLLDPEGAVERRERHGEEHRRAICVRDERSGPATMLPLPLEEAERIRVDLRNDERDVVVHAMRRSVREDERAPPGEERLDFAGGVRVERREQGAARELVPDAAHLQGRETVRQRRFTPPPGGFRVGASGRPLGGGDRDDLEPGVVEEAFEEALPHGAGRTEDADGDLRRAASAQLAAPVPAGKSLTRRPSV